MTTTNEPTMPVLAGWLGSWQFSVRRRPLPVRELAHRYDRLAPDWPALAHRFGLTDTYTQLFAGVLESTRAPLSASPRVLDVGAGAGDCLLGFTQAWDGTAELHAADISAEMLGETQQRLAHEGLAVHCERADVCALPYADNHFDVVMAAHVLEHLPDPQRALAELHRVMKPGGLVVLCLTRESLFGRYVQLKWRTHRLSRAAASEWLAAAGFKPLALGPQLVGRSKHTSLACAGLKSTFEGTV